MVTHHTNPADIVGFLLAEVASVPADIRRAYARGLVGALDEEQRQGAHRALHAQSARHALGFAPESDEQVLLGEFWLAGWGR